MRIYIENKCVIIFVNVLYEKSVLSTKHNLLLFKVEPCYNKLKHCIFAQYLLC